MLLGVFAHEAGEHDSRGSVPLIQTLTLVHAGLQRAYVDKAYVGDAANLLQAEGIEVIVPPKQGKGFAVQPLRWRVERTIAWLKNFRRLCADFDRSAQATEAFIWLAGVVLMLRRLCRKPTVWRRKKVD